MVLFAGLLALGAPPQHGMARARPPATGTRLAVPARTGAAGTAPDEAAASEAARACGGLPRFSPAAADEIMAGRLTIPPFPAATIDPGRDGDISWGLDPFRHPTWQQTFQSGSWIEMLVSGYLAGATGRVTPARAAAYRARAAAITKSWLAGGPASSRDPQVLICLSEGFPGQAWIDGQIDTAVNWLMNHWQGAWNHGLRQDLKLMQIGCAYPATAFHRDALAWRQAADRQILSSFRPNRLGPSIDPDGVVNEQSTGYEKYVWDLWSIGVPELAACGYPLPAAIRARIAKMPAFLAAATQPDGNLVQIGDTYVESPPGGRGHPPGLVSVYRAGYVFGRTGWSPAATFYSLRFGPGREIHGHDDHMGVTYFARGRNLIVNAGHTGYEVSPYRTYIRSPAAASTLVAPGQAIRSSAPTRLTAVTVRAGWQYYQLADYAFGGPRHRSVYVHDGPDFMLVLDRAAGAAAYQQLWHLDPGLAVSRVTARTVVAAAPARGPALATTLVIDRIELPGQVIPAGSTRVVRGQVHPYQGWVSHQALQRVPAPVVEMTSRGTGAGRSTTMLTLIVATAPGTRVHATATGHGATADRVVITIGSATVQVTVSLASGAIS